LGCEEAPDTGAGSGDRTGLRIWGAVVGLQEGKWELGAEGKAHLLARAGEGSARSQSKHSHWSRNTLSKALTHQGKTRFADRSSGSP